MKKILITGGAGFIGSHTAISLLEADFEPIILDDFSNSESSVLKGLKRITDKDIVLHQGDCTDRLFLEEVFDKHDFMGVIHFAAFKAVGESTQNPLKYYHNNLASLVVLLEVMKKHNVKNLVFSSSCTVYGQPDKLPVSENTPRKNAESPYGNTKKICEDILRDYIVSGADTKIISLRYFNPVGAHPSGLIGELPLGVPNNLVPFITQTAAGIREKLTVFGDDYDTPDGSCVRDYIHVMDLADAHVKALAYLLKGEEPLYEVFNVGTGNGNTVLEVIHAFEKITGEKLNYQIGSRRPGDVVKVWASTDKIMSELAWTPKYSLEDSMRDAWNWQCKLTQQNSRKEIQ